MECATTPQARSLLRKWTATNRQPNEAAQGAGQVEAPVSSLLVNESLVLLSFREAVPADKRRANVMTPPWLD